MFLSGVLLSALCGIFIAYIVFRLFQPYYHSQIESLTNKSIASFQMLLQTCGMRAEKNLFPGGGQDDDESTDGY